MRITKIEVENFKSLKNLSVSNFLNVNMIYGYNNSGKSNLLKFIELVFSTREYKTQLPIENPSLRTESQTKKENFWDKSILNQPFIFRKEGEKKFDIKFSIYLELDTEFLSKNVSGYDNLQKDFIGKGVQVVNLRIDGAIEQLGDFNAQQRLVDVSLGGKTIYESEKNSEPKIFPGAKHSTFREFQSLMSLFNDCVILLDNDRYFINEDEKISDDDLSAKNFKNKIFELHLKYLKDEEFKGLNDFLKSFNIESADKVFANNEKSSPFKNFQFEFIRFNSEIEVMLTNDFGKFPLSSFGTGVQQIIFILSKIFLSNKKIILIEEIELNLSPKYQIELIEFINKGLITNKKISQLFYTTHSPLLCYRTEFRSLQARIDENGVSTIETVTPNPTDVTKFREAMKLLEHYHPAAKPKQNPAKANPTTPVKRATKKGAVKKGRAKSKETKK
jgi:AAA15 family ATPase/GTPase